MWHHQCSWISMKIHVVKRTATHIYPWKSTISSKFMDRLVYEKSCVLTTWKFIDFHVNPSLATNGNEQFVWVSMIIFSSSLPGTFKVNTAKYFQIHPELDASFVGLTRSGSRPFPCSIPCHLSCFCCILRYTLMDSVWLNMQQKYFPLIYHFASLWKIDKKALSSYWMKFAQSLIQRMPMWDTK